MRRGPDYIQLYPTMRCDRSCGFCFNRAMPDVRDMPAPAFEAMIAVLRQAAVKTLDIMGGEPALHPDIIRFVAAASTAGFSVNISSNGSRPEVLAALMRIEGRITVGVSINDRETLVRMRSFIATRRPVVKSVHHAGMDESLVGEILALDPKRFYLIYRDGLDPAGLAETSPFYEFHDALQRFDAARVGSVFCSGFLPDAASAPELASVRCPAGTTKLGILPDGSVYPCNLFFGREAFLLGNILRDPFPDIWNHPVLAYFRSDSGNACPRTACSLHGRCHGGCPAHSVAHAGRLDLPDPRCVRGYEPDHA